MKSNLFFCILGIFLGILGYGLYSTFSHPRTIPLSNQDWVDGRYFVFKDENETRIIERTSSGLVNRTFIPGPYYNEMLEKNLKPEILDTINGEIIFLREMHFNTDRIDIKVKFYRYENNKMIEIPFDNSLAL